MRLDRPTLTVEQLLAWSDAHHARTGKLGGTTAGGVVPGRRIYRTNTVRQRG
jgi:hypothetical protein